MIEVPTSRFLQLPQLSTRLCGDVAHVTVVVRCNISKGEGSG
jgi:hypothetical protein